MGPIGLIDPFEQITAQAVRDLAACGAAPKIGFAEKLRAFFGRKTAPFDPLNWPAGMLLLGLWEAGEEEAVKHYFDCWLEGDGAVLRVDDALAGAVLAELFRAGADARYGEAVKKVYDFLQAAPKNEEGCLYYRPGDGREAVFADGAGMAALFYVRYAMAFSDEAALRAARNELAGFFGMGQTRRRACRGTLTPCERIRNWGSSVGDAPRGGSCLVFPPMSRRRKPWAMRRCAIGIEISAARQQSARRRRGFSPGNWQRGSPRPTPRLPA